MSADGRVKSRGLRLSLLNTIRNKIILPFLLLTMIVAAVGTFVITRLVASSIQDRLTNQLVETSRAAGDGIVAWETYHLDVLRLAIFTVGVPDAIAEHDKASLNTALLAIAANQHAYLMAGIDKDGECVAAVRLESNGDYTADTLQGQNLGDLPMIRAVLEGQQDQFGDKHAGILRIDGETILLTVAPASNGSGRLVGAVAIGTPLQQILQETKASIMADLSVYQSDGQTLAATYLFADGSDISSLNVTPELFARALQESGEATIMRTITINQREHQAAYAPLRIRRDTLGVVSVSIPNTIVANLISTNRSGLSIVFSLLAVVVVLMGFAIAQNLSKPIQTLTQTAQAVTAGDLQQQSNIRSGDEIGILSRSFDHMTRSLAAQRQALEDAYQEQQREAAFLSAVLMSTADGTVVFSQQSGEDTRLNPAADEIISANYKLWLSILTELANQVLEDHKPARQTVEIERQWFEAVAAPVLMMAGDEIGVVITLRDVTDQVLTERMRTAFIMQISHELRTPLTAMKGYIDLSRTMLAESDSRVLCFLDMAGENTDVLTRMVNQILDVTEMVRGTFDIVPQMVEIPTVLDEAIKKFRESIQAKGLKVSVAIDELPLYRGDKERLAWAFEHLVRNACDYTMPGGHIGIFANHDNGNLVIRVHDDGVGIAPRDLPRVFEQFYRGHPVAPDGTVIDVRGAGLGLFVVRAVVAAHNGSIDVRSRPGDGSEFIISLPYTAHPDDEDSTSEQIETSQSI
ncbi:MAG: HAMP domain-containing protein [Anaerolineae bacterium]|nr:HAMP domain-containing protein [Anaerolineae bacterium]